MAAKKKVKKSAPAKVAAPAKKRGRPVVNEAEAAAKKKGVPFVVFVPKKLKGMAKIAAMANGASLSEVVREFLENYVNEQRSAIKEFLEGEMSGDEEDEDVEEEEDTEVEEDEDEDDEDEEEEDEDEDDDE